MEEGESVAMYVTRLKRLAASCNFHDVNDCVRDQVIDKVRSQYLRRKFLEEGAGLTLARVLELSRAEEAMSAHLDAYRQQEQESVNRVRETGSSDHRKVSADTGLSSVVCFRCRRRGHRADSSSCVALGKECRDCGQVGHFAGAKFCKGNKKTSAGKDHREMTHVQAVGHGDEHMFTIREHCKQEQVSSVSIASSANVTVDISGLAVTVVVDSGAASNLAGEDVCEQLQSKGVPLVKTTKRLFAYGGERPLDLVGEMEVVFACNKRSVRTVLYILRGKSATLLGLETASELGVLCIRQSGVMGSSSGIGTVGAGDRSIEDVLMEKYPASFVGVGKLKGQTVSLHIDESINPVAQPVRRIPFGHRELAEKKLKQLVADDIVERVEGPTPWVSPLVTVAKDDGKDVRICVDMRCANKAIKRERHPIPTLKEIAYNLNGAKFFSKADLKLGFHQLELDEDSRSITTFVTPWGLFRYKRLSLGISSAPEVYQHVIQSALLGLSGTFTYADDIIVAGSTQGEHDERLEALLKRLSELNLTLNPKKVPVWVEIYQLSGPCDLRGRYFC